MAQGHQFLHHGNGRCSHHKSVTAKLCSSIANRFELLSIVAWRNLVMIQQLLALVSPIAGAVSDPNSRTILSRMEQGCGVQS